MDQSGTVIDRNNFHPFGQTARQLFQFLLGVGDDGQGMPWSVSGVSRAAAGQIAQIDGRSVYGGATADNAVIEAIQHLNGAGKDVVFYPFILMEQLEGNANYPLLLLTLTSRPDAQVAPPVKLAAAINLKNLVKRRWQTVSIKLSLHQLYEI